MAKKLGELHPPLRPLLMRTRHPEPRYVGGLKSMNSKEIGALHLFFTVRKNLPKTRHGICSSGT